VLRVKFTPEGAIIGEITGDLVARAFALKGSLEGQDGLGELVIGKNVRIDHRLLKRLRWRQSSSRLPLSLNGPQNGNEGFLLLDRHPVDYVHVRVDLLLRPTPSPIENGCRRSYARRWWRFRILHDKLERIHRVQRCSAA